MKNGHSQQKNSKNTQMFIISKYYAKDTRIFFFTTELTKQKQLTSFYPQVVSKILYDKNFL